MGAEESITYVTLSHFRDGGGERKEKPAFARDLVVDRSLSLSLSLSFLPCELIPKAKSDFFSLLHPSSSLSPPWSTKRRRRRRSLRLLFFLVCPFLF